MQTPIDLNQSRIVLKQDSTLIGVIEMSERLQLRSKDDGRYGSKRLWQRFTARLQYLR
jgi:hypothetical protein